MGAIGSIFSLNSLQSNGKYFEVGLDSSEYDTWRIRQVIAFKLPAENLFFKMVDASHCAAILTLVSQDSQTVCLRFDAQTDNNTKKMGILIRKEGLPKEDKVTVLQDLIIQSTETLVFGELKRHFQKHYETQSKYNVLFNNCFDAVAQIYEYLSCNSKNEDVKDAVQSAKLKVLECKGQEIAASGKTLCEGVGEIASLIIKATNQK